MTVDDPDAVVIGAGLAGLAAATALVTAGRRVLILEARSRVGGRVHTVTAEAGTRAVDLGAEFVDRRAWTTFRNAAPRLAAVEMRDAHWYVENGRVDVDVAFWARIAKRLRASAGSRDRSFATFLRTEFAGPAHAELRRRATAYVEGFHAADPRRASVRDLASVEQAAGFGGNPQLRLVGGAATLPRALAAALPPSLADLRLGHPVAAVRWRRGHVEIDHGSPTGATHTTRAAAAIVTVPLPLLANPRTRGAIRFDPPLPEKVAAARRLATGAAQKLVADFRSPWWHGHRLRGEHRAKDLHGLVFLHAPGAAVPTWWTQLPLLDASLTAWIAGPAAARVRRRTPAVRHRALLESLATTLRIPLRTIEPELRGIHEHDWQHDPWSRGAYSYVPVGGIGARRDLGAPVAGTLFFAGEATAATDASTMHGAFASGRRAAAELLAS